MLSNSKQEALNVALDGKRRGGGGGESSVDDLTRAITEDIRRMPGNNNCCDCGAPGNKCFPAVILICTSVTWSNIFLILILCSVKT